MGRRSYLEFRVDCPWRFWLLKFSLRNQCYSHGLSIAWDLCFFLLPISKLFLCSVFSVFVNHDVLWRFSFLVLSILCSVCSCICVGVFFLSLGEAFSYDLVEDLVYVVGFILAWAIFQCFYRLMEFRSSLGLCLLFPLALFVFPWPLHRLLLF